MEEDITRPVELDLVDLGHRPRRTKSSATTAASLATFSGYVPRNKPMLMMVHHRLQGPGESSATTAQDGDIWPKTVRQSRVVGLVVSVEVGAAGIKVVPEVIDRTEESASTWSRRTRQPS